MPGKVDNPKWKYPVCRRRKAGRIVLHDHPPLPTPHRLYWEEYGNPDGEPVLYIHGGPGGSATGGTATITRFFNLKRYRLIIYDQRGCGRSTPSVAARDPKPGLAHNTTPHLIDDIMRLRIERGLHGRMHVFGGSWGSTLALAYAIAHPETVQTLILRGIFLCRKEDIDYFYQGNAATYAQDPLARTRPGAYMFFPEPWQKFVAMIPTRKRGDMIAAYADIFAKKPESNAIRKAQAKAAIAWSIWEGLTSGLKQDIDDLGKFLEVKFATVFARIENHYFMNGAFLGGHGKANRDNNYLLERVRRIKNIPIHIVHGRYDQVCPMFQADDLVAALKHAGAKKISYTVTAAGHSMIDRENYLAMVKIMDALPKMKNSAPISRRKKKI